MLGVGANESFIEDAARKLIEILFFDGLEHARTDLDDIGNVIKRKFFRLARLAEFVPELAHVTLNWRCDVGNMIGQAAATGYREEERMSNLRESRRVVQSAAVAGFRVPGLMIRGLDNLFGSFVGSVESASDPPTQNLAGSVPPHHVVIVGQDHSLVRDDLRPVVAVTYRNSGMR